jgi:anti-sigma28 factor (negative regulator of flagellin synthesis)
MIPRKGQPALFFVFLFVLLSPQAGAQWKQKMNSRGELRDVYEIPKSTPGSQTIIKPDRSSSSSSSSTESSSSGSRFPASNTYRPTESDTKAVAKMKQAIEDGDYRLFYEIYDDPYTTYNPKASLGSKQSVGKKFLFDVSILSAKDYSYLPLIYQGFYIKKLSYQLPVFHRFDYGADMAVREEYCITRSCIFLGDYEQAINNFRNTPLYGKKSLNMSKREDDYKSAENARNYINYMTGRCFEALVMADSAKKYLKLGSGFEEEWNKLYEEGAPYREEKKLYDPAKAALVLKKTPALPRPPVSYVTECVTGNCKDGKGEKTWSNGDRYIGDFKDGVEDGKGVCYYITGDTWEGAFMKGAIYGEGKFSYKDGWVYIGRMVSKKTQGYGKLYNSAGILVYDGSWSNNKENGEGKSYDNAGNLVSSGNFVDGKNTPLQD